MVVRRRTNARFSCAFGRIGVQIPGCTSNRNSYWPGMLVSQIGRRARVGKVKSDRLPSCTRPRRMPPVRVGLWRKGGPRWGCSSAICAMTWGSRWAMLQVQTVGDKWICLRTSASAPRGVVMERLSAAWPSAVWWRSWLLPWLLVPRRRNFGPRALRALPMPWLRPRRRARARRPRMTLPIIPRLLLAQTIRLPTNPPKLGIRVRMRLTTRAMTR